ncbi:hypothetical protein MASR2M8_20210 [Opitutaceae bacterium]
MGFFDRLAGKKSSNPAPKPAAPSPASEPAGAPSGGLVPQLTSARERLEAKDLPGALAIYEQILAVAGDRPDVLVTISGDLGTCGYVESIIELIAPRYDAERHGPATGINLVQAYLATRNPNAAQHLLDILFSLGRPELEERLWGFSNAIAEQIEAQRKIPGAGASTPGGAASAPVTIELVSISKPIWAYGVESMPGLVPAKETRVRRVAFGQLACPGVADFEERMKKPEDDLGRFVRGFPLWLAETFVYSPHYASIAAIGAVKQQHYALFPTEWNNANIRQLVDTSSDGVDYVFTGAMREVSGDTELVLRVWEIKKFRERKTFTARWSPATADRELANLHEQIRLFMEWSPYPAGVALAYTPAPRPTEWIHTLGASLSLFLADKQVLPVDHIPPTTSWLDRIAENAATTESASIAWLTAADRARRLGLVASVPAVQLADGPIVTAAQQALG